MPKNSVSDWDTDQANNDDVGGVELRENVARPRDVNNAVRTVMAQIKTAFGSFLSAWTPASASGPASLAFAEDTDNGTNKITLVGQSSLASDLTVTLPGVAGTLIVNNQIGVTVQAYDADLTTWAGLTPSANAQSLVTAANYAAMRGLLDLEAGTDFYSISAANAAFQPIDADLTSWAAVARASGFDTFAATPSSANLAALVTGETGSGPLVFATSPTLVTPVLGVATGTQITVGSNQYPAIFVWTDDSAFAGPYFQIKRYSANPAANDFLGALQFIGNDSGGNEAQYGALIAQALDPTNGSEDGAFVTYVAVAGADVAATTVANGMIVGNPTGGLKGTGTINATAVYDDNTLLTCMALQKDFLEKGYVDLGYWDALVPGLVIPATETKRRLTYERTVTVEEKVQTRDREGRLVQSLEEVTKVERIPAFHAEPVYDEKGDIVDAVETPRFEIIAVPERIEKRIHGTAHLFAQMVADGFDPRDPAAYIARLKANEALPGMPTKAEWQHGGLSSGEMFNRLWLATEMLALVVMNLHERVKALGGRVMEKDVGIYNDDSLLTFTPLFAPHSGAGGDDKGGRLTPNPSADWLKGGIIDLEAWDSAVPPMQWPPDAPPDA